MEMKLKLFRFQFNDQKFSKFLFFFKFPFFFFCQPKLYLNSPNHTFQQIFYLSRKGPHFSGEHTTTC